jgi:lysophospholipase L1-like esterase
MRSAKRRCLGLLVAVSVPLCLLASSGPANAWTTSRSAKVAPRSGKVAPGSEYVALGSSYAAGFGIQPQTTSAGSCGRSAVDYPHLVAAKLRLNLTDVSCGGAVTANALNTPQGSAPPQIDAVDSTTRLVTITIGGNDVGYIATAIECGQPGSTCAATANPAQITAAFQALPGSLSALIQAVRTKAPSADIVLVTYPRLVPPTSCPALHYSPAATNLVASIGSRLERVFVSVAKAQHVQLVDPYVIGAAHGPCAKGANRWIAGLVPTNGFEYHPTVAGHQEMAHLVEHEIGY